MLSDDVAASAAGAGDIEVESTSLNGRSGGDGWGSLFMF